MPQTIGQAAKELAALLSPHVYVLQQWNSLKKKHCIYLKIDYGTAGSVRIADEDGENHLRYRYNIIMALTAPDEHIDKTARYYWPPSMIADAAEKILANREEMLKHCGGQQYVKYMGINRRNARQDYWRYAKTIKMEDDYAKIARDAYGIPENTGNHTESL